ncbi:MAG TPA: helix-turn-helix transcriptional regulator [Thermomicrobiales bacterium]|nr:helix-turn-helix transcriptional regulator [Thermomicrobiales bacterium]
MDDEQGSPQEWPPVAVENIPIDRTTHWHSHETSQLAYTSDGVMTVQTANGVWVVPPQRAVWIPGGERHAISARRPCRMQALYAHPGAVHISSDCCVVFIDPLTRELLVEAASFPDRYPADGPEARLMQVILDRLSRSEAEPLSIPRPRDERLRRLCDLLQANVADQRTLAELASEVGMTSRTAARLFRTETTLTFARWRQQIRLLSALELLGEGESVAQVANAVGYRDVSSFIAMFRQALGTSPARYFATMEPRRPPAHPDQPVS